MQLKLNISIDDVNPKPGWRIIGEPVQKYLEDLHKQYGVKVTLFIPANHHGDAQLSKNKSWIQELRDLKFIEFGAHGYYHNTKDSNKWGECEFGELSSKHEISWRIHSLINEWNSCDILPKVWKSPGWLTSRESVAALGSWFKYAVIHPQHNHNLMWQCQTINASDFFPPNSFPSMDCNMFILSHIHGRHDNVWNENFFNHVQNVLNHINSTSIIMEHSFIKDM